MNQHVANIEIGYRLSSDDAKQGIRELESLEDFGNMIRMFKQRVPRTARGRPITVNIIDLTSVGDSSQQAATGRGKSTKVRFCSALPCVII